MARKRNQDRLGSPFDDKENKYGSDIYSDDTDNTSPYGQGSSIRRYREQEKKKRSYEPYIVAGIVVLISILIFLIIGKSLGTWHHTVIVTPPPRQTANLSTPVPTTALSKQTPVQENIVATPVPTAGQTTPVELTDRYFGRKLGTIQKTAYEKIRDGVAVHDAQIDIKLTNIDDVVLVADSVCWDYPEYFWFTTEIKYSYSMNGDTYSITVEPVYRFDANEYISYSAEVDSVFQPVINSLYSASDYEKVKGVYVFLIEYTKYDLAYHGMSIYELARDGRAVCEAYARATQYMLTKLGVETLFVVGDSDSDGTGMEGHAWNIVKLDGEYYNVDTTWGDPVMTDGSQKLVYDYLCVTDKDLQKTHLPDDNGYPECTATKYNYYRLNNRYLDSYDESVIANWIAQANGGEVAFQLASEDLYNETMSQLFDKGRIFDIAETAIGEGNISYVYGNNQNMRTISLKIN